MTVWYNPDMHAAVTLHIRPYQSQDREAVVALWERCGLVVPHNDPHRDIERKRRVNPEWFLVGILGGTLVASCMAAYEGHRGWINYLAVSPDSRRKGVATQIMQRAETLLAKAGCPKINLQVRETNQGVIAFYESLGFRNDRVISMGKLLGDAGRKP
jgi:ribosomal protein S18 acetylase RimI-like enzyme